MPKPKRSPINYSPSFGGGIFRSKSDIEGDLAQLETNQLGSEPMSLSSDPSDQDGPSAIERSNERTNERSAELDAENGTSFDLLANERSNERTNERARVRHSFDIYSDQLISLGDIQITLHRQSGRKPKLGDLVQEALDEYIERCVRTNERTNVSRKSK